MYKPSAIYAKDRAERLVAARFADAEKIAEVGWVAVPVLALQGAVTSAASASSGEMLDELGGAIGDSGSWRFAPASWQRAGQPGLARVPASLPPRGASEEVAPHPHAARHLRR